MTFTQALAASKPRSWLVLLLLSLSPWPAYACMGPMTEVAQENDAGVVFKGRLRSYSLDTSGPVITVTSGAVARVEFDVIETIRGTPQKTWTAIMRGDSLPKNQAEFERRFGRTMRVGLRDFGKRIDQKALPKGYRGLWFVVDAACSMNGEDWLLRKL